MSICSVCARPSGAHGEPRGPSCATMTEWHPREMDAELCSPA